VADVYDCFTDAAGNVFLHGQEEPTLRAVGFVHRHPCPHYAIATVSIGKTYGCDCGGTVLMGWRDWWPLPDEPHVPAVVIDCTAGDTETSGSSSEADQ
jgi:hypothetical protein